VPSDTIYASQARDYEIFLACRGDFLEILVAVIFLCGMTIIGSQTGANATCGKLYPARMRTSGHGSALGLGRLGGIAAPLLAAIC
jgi:hypothetical protein